MFFFVFFFFFNDTATTEIYTLSLHDALSISWRVVPNFRLSYTTLPSRISRTTTANIFLCTSTPAIGFIVLSLIGVAEDRFRYQSPLRVLPVLSPEHLIHPSVRGPRSFTRTASPSPVSTTPSTAAPTLPFSYESLRAGAKRPLVSAASRFVSTL